MTGEKNEDGFDEESSSATDNLQKGAAESRPKRNLLKDVHDIDVPHVGRRPNVYQNPYFKDLKRTLEEDAINYQGGHVRPKRQTYNVFENALRSLIYGNVFEGPGPYNSYAGSSLYTPSNLYSPDNYQSSYSPNNFQPAYNSYA